MSYIQFPKIFPQKSFKTSLVALSVLGAFAVTGTASADQDNSLQNWVKAADAAVDEVMTYPSFASRRGHSGRSDFTVTIDRSGDVVSSDLVANYGRHSLKSAALRVLDDVELPPIPSSYGGNRLTFSLQLNYIVAGSASEALALERGTQVRGEPVPYGSSGRITILSAAAD